MNVASYSIAGSYGNYNAAKTSQTTSSKSFTIPSEAPMIGVLTFQREDHNYDPFKDIAETGKINFPEWMQTKTMPTRSDEEILKDLEELVKELAKTGEDRYENSDRWVELMDEYVSSVSPDRKGILEKAVTEIHERLHQDGSYGMSAAFLQINSQRTEEEEKKEKKEAVDYLLEALKNRGKGKGSSGTISNITANGPYSTVDVDHGGGMLTHLHFVNGVFTSMTLTGNNYQVGNIDIGGVVREARFYDDDGNKIMDYNGNDDAIRNLMAPWTEAEGKRFQDVKVVCDAAYDIATGDRRSLSYASKEYKEAYNKAYERLSKAA